MKKVIVSLFAIAAFVLTATADDVANKTVTVQGRARIITPITLENTSSQSLDFGIIARGTSESTVVVAASASPSVSVTAGDAVVLTSYTQTAAKFTVGGESGKSYAITIPSTTQTITDGTNTLNITDFTCSNGATGTIGSFDVFYVGGKLTIPSAAVAASYTGTFNVTVNYN